MKTRFFRIGYFCMGYRAGGALLGLSRLRPAALYLVL